MSENKPIVEQNSRDSELDSLFSNYSENSLTILDIPSKGKFYQGFQGIEVKPLTYLDEQKILGSKTTEDVVSKLLEKSIEGVNVNELLSMDKIYLLMKVREASYGDNYQFNITCPNCNSDIHSELVLSEHLNMNQVPDDLSDPREVDLPKLKVKAVVRFPRSKEDVFLKDLESSYSNLYRFVISINGNSDPIFVSKAIKRMHILDVKKLISEIGKPEYGVDPRFLFECPECSHTETMAVPLDVNFFSVS
tara:strand:- start:71 stop:817 length:747 start_codon:yes stop_codon:yes gene_type:complete